jgi:Ribbon-helix-helix protein, copG family
MRTTVSLDPDVAAKLRELAQERGTSFKDALNATLRAGLSGGSSGAAAKPYRLKPRRMGLRPDVDLTHALQMAADLEDEEIVRKLQLRK